MKVLFAIAAVLVLAYSPGAGAQTLLDGFAAPGEAPSAGALVDGTPGPVAGRDISLAEIQKSPSPAAIDRLLLESESCQCGDCATCCVQCWPEWYVQAGSILLVRDNDIRSRPLEWNLSAPDPRGIDFDVGAGPLLTLGVRLSPDTAWEATYFGVFGMQGQANTRYLSRVWNTNYASDLNNAELNYVRNWNKLSLIGGFRFLRLNETHYMEADDFPSISYVYQNKFETDTSNDLFGGQIGIRWQQEHRRFFFTTTCKAGVFANQANRSVLIKWSAWEMIYRKDNQSDTDMSFVGDLNVSGGIHLTDTWSLVAGYNLIWIDAVALAADQWGDYAYETISTDGTVFLHGVNVGIEGQW